jgi:glycerol dehydrogenase-like iron-containing ADH family enzyme
MVKKLQGQFKSDGLKKVSPGSNTIQSKPVTIKKKKSKGRIVRVIFIFSYAFANQKSQTLVRKMSSHNNILYKKSKSYNRIKKTNQTSRSVQARLLIKLRLISKLS